MATVQWLSESEMRAWRSFITTSGDLIRALERDLEPFGLDLGDYQLLAMLSEADDRRMRMCDLADILALSRSGLTRRMEGVLKAGLVERVRDTDDGRVVWASMTRHGMDLLRRAAPVHLRSVRRRMIDVLTPSEIKAFGSAFPRLADQLRSAHRARRGGSSSGLR